MTEEIIIDGVNVAGCSEFLKPDGCDDTDCASFQCDRNPNCYYKKLKRIEQENRGLKEEIQFHNKENSNLLAERNAAQIGYDEIREVRERYRSALEKIREMIKQDCRECEFNNDSFCCETGDCEAGKLQIIQNKINEVLNESN